MNASIFCGRRSLQPASQHWEASQRTNQDDTPREARELAGALLEIADVTQRAAWTPKILADVRAGFLPGATDEEIMARLDRLAEHLGYIPVLQPGVLRGEAGSMLVAQARLDLVERVSDALHAADVGAAELITVVDELKRVYDAEGYPSDARA